MIKFFRKTRRNLLIKNKTGKYFKYALGEIVLVVIGILIAIQVSNWNESRIALNKTEAIFDNFEDELKLTIKNANVDILNSIDVDSIIKSVLKNKVTLKDYKDKDYLREVFSYRFTLDPKLGNLDKLLENEENLDKKYKNILLNINRFGFIRSREIDGNNILRVSADTNSDYINLNFPWARLSDSISNNKAYHYFLTDENYKNRLYTHWKKIMDYTNIISHYRSEMILILSNLKILREGYSASKIETLLKELGQQPYKKIAKDKPFAHLVSENRIGKSTLIANFTKHTFKFILKNKKGETLRTGSSVPGELFNVWPSEEGLYGDYLRILEVYKNNEHIDTYKEVQHGYLIFK